MKFIREKDIINNFLEEQCVLEERYTLSASILYLHFQSWWKMKFRSRCLSRKKFDTLLKKRKFKLKESMNGWEQLGIKRWIGIKLICQ